MTLHPFSWVLISLWITSLAVLISSLPILGLLIVLALLAALFARGRELAPYLKGIKRLAPLILSLLIIQTLFRQSGDLIWEKGWFKIYSSGLYTGLEVSLRLIILLIAAGILGRLSFADFRNAFFFLPTEFSFMISYVVHLIPLLRKRFLHYLQVLRLRGIVLNRLPLGKRLKVYQVVSLSVLGSLLHSSDLQAITLELRGFRSPGKKTYLYKQHFTYIDLLVALILALLTWGIWLIKN